MSLTQGIPSRDFDAKPAIVLCVAGFDPCGGAGLLADARAIAAFGGYALGVQTALVPQNTDLVRACAPTSPELLRLQLETLREDIAFDAIKIGLLPDVATIEIVAEFVRDYPSLPVVVDPVLAPTRGAAWSDAETLSALREQIIPLATMLTPNVPEAQILAGRAITDLESMRAAAIELRAHSGAAIVLLKGGHLPDTKSVDDVYADTNGIEILRAPRIEGIGVRGTGCLLASAIAAQLAQGIASLDAAQNAKRWMSEQWREAQVIGQGRRIAVI